MRTHQYIETKFPRLLQGVQIYGSQLDAADRALISRMELTPKFCLTWNTLMFAAGEAAAKSIELLFRAGSANHLPHPALVELPHLEGVMFLLLEEHHHVMGHDDSRGRTLTSDFRASVVSLAIDALPQVLGGGDILALEKGHFLVRAGGPDKPTSVEYLPGEPGIRSNTARIDALLVVIEVAVKALILLMNDGGLKGRLVEAAPALNKARAARGKVPIPAHTVLHLAQAVRT